MLAASVVSVAMGSSPKLAVGIVVDGLQQEYIDLLRDYFGKDGFNRFLNSGVVLENVDYGPGVDPVAATAILMTGAAPGVNGIGAEMRYDAAAKRLTPVLNDNSTLGNFTAETYSPKALRVSTISDEARIAGGGVTYAHSIAADPSLAIIMAGHAGNSAAWLNTNTGNWGSSTYYTDYPQALGLRNRTKPLSARLDTMQWTPSVIASDVDFIPDHLRRYPFRHIFNQKDDRFAAFAASPKINTEVTDIADEYIRNMQLGTHDGTDVLNVAYTLKPYPYVKGTENRFELIDSYLKLDSDIARLLNTVYSVTGTDGAVVFLAATPPRPSRRRDDERWNIPAGEFSTRKAISLLNLYLMAIHGNGDWVTAYANNQFYLNHQLAKTLNKDIREIREQAADFLKRMAGIERAYTIDAILSGTAPVENPDALRRNTVIDDSGDVTIAIVPGWQLLDDYNNYHADTSQITITPLTTAPVYMLLPSATPQTVSQTVDARAIAPTVAGQMRIRAPNGASLPRLRLNAK